MLFPGPHNLHGEGAGVPPPRPPVLTSIPRAALEALLSFTLSWPQSLPPNAGKNLK